jgi:hypothetical protein
LPLGASTNCGNRSDEQDAANWGGAGESWNCEGCDAGVIGAPTDRRSLVCCRKQHARTLIRRGQIVLFLISGMIETAGDYTGLRQRSLEWRSI